jgi:SNF2 family DNA or RNA helicase
MASNILLTNVYNGSHVWHTESILNTLNLGFQRALTATAPQIKQPSEINIALKPHQCAVVYAMAEHEKQSISGIQYMDSLSYTNYGILGDEVGSGKSLSILAFIAYKKANQISMTKNILYPYSKSNFFTICKKIYDSSKPSPALIVVPHTIYRQWQEYIKKQTTLNVFYAKSSRELSPSHVNDLSGNTVNADFIKKLIGSDIVLVSNTLYQEVQVIAAQKSIVWSNVFIDEADSIYISGGNLQPTTPFTWFITATWSNFLLNGHYIRPLMLDYYQNHQEKFTPELGTWLRSELGLTEYSNLHHGRVAWLRVRSSNWLREFFSDHILRSITLVFCSKPFLEESQKMPGIIEENLLCDQPASHRAVLGLVNTTVQNMIHAGNIEGALSELGVSTDTPVNLVQAATNEREKELDRLKKTLAFKETMEYATLVAKENALTSLKTKISSVEEQLKTFRERLSISEDCPICYEDPKAASATLTPCCHRIFCGECILNSLTRRLACPMCRAPIQTNQLIRLVDEKKKLPKKLEKKLLSKSKQLIKFLKENPEAKVLVFSRYENPFVSLEKDCDTIGISYQTLRGNKDVIANTVKSFESGEKRVLFLPTQTAGAGLNLVSATHVVLLHAMTPEEEKQVIGRAYRLGRQEVLKVVRLLHEGEKILN